jgi:hypothetical protein
VVIGALRGDRSGRRGKNGGKGAAEGEWRAYFTSSPVFEPAGFGVAATPWAAVQRAAWAAIEHKGTRA